MNFIIITGTSSGIGEAIAKNLIIRQHHIFCISRKFNESLSELAASTESRLWFYEADLNETDKLPELMCEIFTHIPKDDIDSVTLINNAGTLEPVTSAGNYDYQQILEHLNVNLLAPVILTNEFIRLSAELKVKKNVVNIGSGAARKPYAGWGLYCSSKAGLEMFTMTTSLEQNHKQFPVRVLSIAPGIVDTPMQHKIRNTAAENFPMKSKFDKLYEENLLSSPSDVAEKILNLLFSNKPVDKEIIDLREL